MKFLRLFFSLLSVSILLASCSEDDTKVSFDEEELVGTWQLSALNYEGTSSTEYAGTKATVDYTGEGFDMNLDVQFSTGPNEMVSSGDYSILLEISSYGQKQTQEWTNQQFASAGSWTVHGDEIKIDTQATEQVFKVLSINETTLKMLSQTTQTTSQSGTTTTLDVEILYIFEKQ